MFDNSLSGEFVDDGARRSTFGDIDVLSGFAVGDGFMQVGIGPEAESGDSQNSNHDYQQYEPLHFWFRRVLVNLIWIEANSFLIRDQKVAQDRCRRFAIDECRDFFRLDTLCY